MDIDDIVIPCLSLLICVFAGVAVLYVVNLDNRKAVATKKTDVSHAGDSALGSFPSSGGDIGIGSCDACGGGLVSIVEFAETKLPYCVKPGNVPESRISFRNTKGAVADACANASDEFDDDTESHCWMNCPGSEFVVRGGPDYSINRLKVCSSDSIYEVFAVSTYMSQCKIPHIGRVAVLPIDPDALRLGLPPYLICNFMVPQYSHPRVFGRARTDGPSLQVTLYCRVSTEVRVMLLEGRSSPAVELLRKFMHPVDGAVLRKERLKLIMGVVNVDDCGLDRVTTAVIKAYNYKPFLSRTASTFYLTQATHSC